MHVFAAFKFQYDRASLLQAFSYFIVTLVNR
jgi:hypothetical protein